MSGSPDTGPLPERASADVTLAPREAGAYARALEIAFRRYEERFGDSPESRVTGGSGEDADTPREQKQVSG